MWAPSERSDGFCLASELVLHLREEAERLKRGLLG
jgi:hypothetical protein